MIISSSVESRLRVSVFASTSVHHAATNEAVVFLQAGAMPKQSLEDMTRDSYRTWQVKSLSPIISQDLLGSH